MRGLLSDKALVRDAKPITLSENNSEPEPDLAIVEQNRAIYRIHHPYPENIFWLIEYANTSLKKDLDAKRKTYAVAGITEYWIVDLIHRQVKIFREPLNGDYGCELTLIEGEISPLVFPEISVSIQRLLGI